MKKVSDAYETIDVENVGYVLNQQRANMYKKKLDALKPGKEMDVLLYDYADELLRAGNIDLSINIFEDFLAYFTANEILGKVEAVAEVKRKLAIAYMRKAELENCVSNHNNESCIIPISPKAQYVITENVEKAVKYMEDFLDIYPRDYEIHYLLNIAYMTLGQYPDSVPEIYRIPESYFDNVDFPKFTDVAMDLGLDINALSGGVCIDDFNNDGYLDLIISSWGHKDQIRYFENDKNGGFEDRTSYSGLVGVTGGLNLKHADYDNDGNLDFIILRGAWLENYGGIPNSLIRNNGDGTFTDVTEKAGVLSYHPTQTAVWRDFNLDGWIDLFIGNESSPKGKYRSELYLNNADGTFSNVSEQSGIDSLGFYKGVAAGDINNDGYPDLYISNFNGNNLLFQNVSYDGDLQFNLLDSSGVSEPIESFSTWMFDYNNDGWEDIFVSAYSSGQITPVNMMMANARKVFNKRRPKLYRNNGDNTFTDVSEIVGLDEPVTTMGCNFGDLDNDGFLDFYLATGDPSFVSLVPNKMYLNKGGESFQDITYSGGFGHIQKGHAIGFGDLDQDGDQDVYAVMGGAYEGDNFQNVLFENPIGNENNWINIKLEGSESNRSAIGARIILTLDIDGKERKVFHTVGTGASFGGNSILAEIGIGQATEIKEIIVKWPIKSATVSKFNKVQAKQHILIKEGADDIEVLTLNAMPFKKKAHHHH
ncbi:hypothetical protein GCM10007940_04730 [Portibacter lacus]|uniref:ASPIC/UnbV domain-containing protein n=2 Tax=Portibacter lacus TaxID=1099794 RepID=A0AA37SNJ0_9BACT|nr:hypothetical protein GCM10007940_04730 [Portibacter lacus]